jgi:hypothetical protein
VADTDVTEPKEGVAPAAAPEFDLDAALRQALRGDSSPIDTHLVCLKRDIRIAGTLTRLHCYFLPVDANGRVRVERLAEFLRNRIIDYAIPRPTIQEALAQATETGSMAAMSKLHERARGLFTHLANTGEGGELLLFAMAEAIFGITQVICKMHLKKSAGVHYHGSDGVYAEARAGGGLNLYWGESKIRSNAADAINECLQSLAPFLREPDGENSKRERDVLLVNEFANFSDERLVRALKNFLDPDNQASSSVRHCGFALSGFDCGSYSLEGVEKTADAIAKSIEQQIDAWVETTGRRVATEKLEEFDVHFICVPLPSADEFRRCFLRALGVQE